MHGFCYGKEKTSLVGTTDTQVSLRSNFHFPDSVACILPSRLTEKILIGVENIEEIRLRADRYASITAGGENITVFVTFTREELLELLVKMCKGSLYSFVDDINNGFVTLDGGVRVGVCGNATVEGKRIIGVSEVTSLSIRIPHKTPAVGAELCELVVKNSGCGGVLVFSPPGVGKTTLLRGMARLFSGVQYGKRVAVIDPRRELAFELSGKELLLDILSGYPISTGIEIAARTLNAQIIICDEIGSTKESSAIISAHGSGVSLIASAHARNVRELMARPGVRALHKAAIFDYYVAIERNGRGGFKYHITHRSEAEYGI